MRIRSILPNFYRSEDVGAMVWDTRLIFIGLWSYVDDNGVGRDVERLIAADLFPYDEARDTLARLSRGLQTLCDGGQIVRYSIDGKPLLFVVEWDAYQRVDRPAKCRYERPTCENAIINERIATPSRGCRDTLATGEGEKGRRGEGEKGLNTLAPAAPKRPSEPAGFIDFWAVYPKRADKGHARTAYATAARTVGVDAILAGAQRLAADPNLPEAKFIPNASTWLRGERWDDGPLPSRNGRPPDRQADLLRSEMVKAQAADALTQRLEIGA